MRKRAGFTLIEVMVVVALVGLIMMLGLPAVNAWIQNIRIRSTGESLMNGIRIARTEAMKRNTRATFWMVNDLTSSCNTSNTSATWIVLIGPDDVASVSDKCANAFVDNADDSKRTIQRSPAGTVASGISISAKSGSTDAMCITFDGLGEVATSGSIACTTPLTTITLRGTDTNSTALDIRRQGSETVLCYPDPSNKLLSTDSRKCP